MICSNCKDDVELDINDRSNMLIFPYGKGRLCRKCYENYDLDIKEIEYKYKILRGFKNENRRYI